MANNLGTMTDVSHSTPTPRLCRDLCLQVMKGLLAVLLSPQGTCSVDFFVLIAKVSKK